MPGRVALALIDESNEFQQILKADAEAAAASAGLQLDVYFTGEDFEGHLEVLRSLIEDEGRRPQAIVVMATRDHGLARVVRQAAKASVHWVYLNATEDDLSTIRRESPSTVVATVCPDEVQTGRIQGQQFRALLPEGRRVLYVTGNTRSLASRERTRGVLEAVSGAQLDVVLAGGDWAPEAAGSAVRDWLAFAMAEGLPFDVVGCQNDHMASGVLEALKAAADEQRRPDFAHIPVTGCDGSPEMGQRMVAEGSLAATVVLPRVAGPAVELVGRLLNYGERIPSLVTHAATSFPPLQDLRPLKPSA
jgi:ABC-type sugar transport system substrate-binding protein